MITMLLRRWLLVIMRDKSCHRIAYSYIRKWRVCVCSPLDNIRAISWAIPFMIEIHKCVCGIVLKEIVISKGKNHYTPWHGNFRWHFFVNNIERLMKVWSPICDGENATLYKYVHHVSFPMNKWIHLCLCARSDPRAGCCHFVMYAERGIHLQQRRLRCFSECLCAAFVCMFVISASLSVVFILRSPYHTD